MKKPVKILKQPLWQQGFVLFISILLAFETRNCFPNDDTISNSNYEYLRLLYEDEEEVCRIQLKQLQLTNERLMKRIKANYEKQQAEAKDKRHQEKMLIKNIENFYCRINSDGNSCALEKW